jgi:hypothetical protein
LFNLQYKLRLFAKMPWGRIIAVGLSFSSDVSAVTKPKTAEMDFVTDPSAFRPSVVLPVIDQERELKIPKTKLKTRAVNSKTDTRIEPIQVNIPLDPKGREGVCRELATPGNYERLKSYVEGQINVMPAAAKTEKTVSVSIDARHLAAFDSSRLGQAGLRIHHRVVVDNKRLGRRGSGDSAPITELLRQMKPILKSSEREALEFKVRSGRNLLVDRDLLPRFARQMVGKYLVFRGPNCFHAALAFHSNDLTASPLLNVRREEGYHAAMVNYDELWRVLQSQFYPVDPARSPLKYGDLLVFFDFDSNKALDFRWIRHAAVYLFNDYTFSKGSKSPNTPYTVKTIGEEWHTWRQYSKNLGVKVFRRGSKNATKYPPESLSDWLY